MELSTIFYYFPLSSIDFHPLLPLFSLIFFRICQHITVHQQMPADKVMDETRVHEHEADDKSVNETPDSSDPSESSSSNDDDNNPQHWIRAKDKQCMRRCTLCINMSRKVSKKVFKMDPPVKYSGKKDKDRTYNAVHQFQLIVKIALFGNKCWHCGIHVGIPWEFCIPLVWSLG